MLGTRPTDVYIGAAVISKEVGKPVRLQWMRWDEHGWDAYGPAAMYDVKAGVDAAATSPRSTGSRTARPARR